MMRRVVTSSGFLFERNEGNVVLRGCRQALVALAELEYLREVDPRAAGRILNLTRRSADGRELHVFSLDVPGQSPRMVTFDVGNALVGKMRVLHEAIGLVVYALAGVTAVATLGYLVAQFFG